MGCSQNNTQKPQTIKSLNYRALNYFSLYETAVQQNDLASAIELLKLANDADSTNVYLKEEMITFLFDLSYFDAEIQHTLLSLGKQYLKQDITSPLILKIIFLVATNLIDIPTALIVADRIAVEDKDQPFYERLGDIYLINNDVESAKKAYDAREIKDPTTNTIIAYFYYYAKNDSMASIYIQREINTNNEPAPDIFIFDAYINEKTGNIGQIIKNLKIAEQLYPENPAILNTFGYFIADYQISEMYPKAEKMILKALASEPENMMIWDSLAWLYFQQQEYDKAFSAMRKVLENEITHSEIAYHLGEIFLKLTKFNDAKKYLNLAVQINDDEKFVLLSQKLIKITFEEQK